MQAEPTSLAGRLWERWVVRPLGGPRPKRGVQWQGTTVAKDQRLLERYGVLFEDNKGALGALKGIRV